MRLTHRKEWSLILSRAVNSFRRQALQVSRMSSSYGLFTDLATTFALEIHQWRNDSISRWTERQNVNAGESDYFDIYEYSARLVTQSLALQHALDTAPSTLPSVFLEVGLSSQLKRLTAQYQACAATLIGTIESSRRHAHAARSLPDFFHTTTAYAATSLLRCAQARFARLRPDRAKIFELARKACSLLAEAAIDSDHIAAVQSAVLSKIITAHDVAPGEAALVSDLAFGSSPAARVDRPLEAGDFRAFARQVNEDQNMTLWPPLRQVSASTGTGDSWVNGLPGVGASAAPPEGPNSGEPGK